LGWLREAMTSVASETFTSTSAPIQYAAVRAFTGCDEIEDYLVHSRRILASLGHWIARELNQANIHTLPPQGGFYLFPDFESLREQLARRGITDSRQLCERLLEETGVAILPGTDFGRPDAELTVRLAFVDFDGTAALAASRNTHGDDLNLAFLETNCGKVVEAIRSLCDWATRAD
jgi:aspartate aminotransferase